MNRRIIYSAMALIIVFSLLFSCTACATSTPIANAAELTAGYERKTTVKGEVTDEFKSAMSKFFFELLQKSIDRDSSNNILISPLSAAICLGMVANGASGNTREQMEKVFGMDIETLNECIYAYTDGLYSSDKCKTYTANSIWFKNNDNSLHVNESFLQTNANWYGADMFATAFDTDTVDAINDWCKENTDGMIEKMLESLSKDAVMVLINTLVFDAGWEIEYSESDIKDDTFTNYDKTESTVKMLTSEENKFFSDEKSKGFAKGYADGKYSFMAILPNEGIDVYDYIDSLDGKKWVSMWKSLTNKHVDVKMPEFTYTLDIPLKETLQALGMQDMFDPSDADFSLLGSYDNENIYCSEVRQKVFVQVDRKGTKAAAITEAIMQKTTAIEPSYTESVILDRPFVYAIVDNETGLPLFIGALTQMNQK